MKSASFNKSRLSLKRKYVVGNSSSACDKPLLEKSILLSNDDTFLNEVAKEFDEGPASFSANSSGLSPIPSFSCPSFSSPSSPIINKSLLRTSRCLIPSKDQLNDSLQDSELLAIPDPATIIELGNEDQDLFEESPQRNKTLSDSGCEGVSIDDDDDKPWENSVYVPVTPKSSNITKLSSSRIVAGQSPLICNRSIGIQKISKCNLPQNRSKFEVSLQGLAEINWDETLRYTEKSPTVEESAISSSFSQKFRQQLINNNNKNNLTPSHFNESQNLSEDQCFFGLSSNVQTLIERFRGIKELYGTVIIVHLYSFKKYECYYSFFNVFVFSMAKGVSLYA